MSPARLRLRSCCIERAVRHRSWRYVLGPFLAAIAVVLVLATAFTGYLGPAAIDAPSYLRFRVLHTIVVPFVALIAVFVWAFAAWRMRVHRPSEQPEGGGLTPLEEPQDKERK